VLDGKEDALQLASTHNQVTGDQRSLRGFLSAAPPAAFPLPRQPLPGGGGGVPFAPAAPHDADFQTPPERRPPPSPLGHHGGHSNLNGRQLPPVAMHRQQDTAGQIGGSGGGSGGRQGDMRAFLVPRGRP